MNKTKIEWCDYTWNPVTGCLHGCEYCYARKIDKRFGDGIFQPIFHPERLQEPLKVKKPSRIFVGSVSDLFGNWDWNISRGNGHQFKRDYVVEQILTLATRCPQHTIIFLTKNPKGMQGFDFPNNCWCGTSVENQEKADQRIPELLKVNSKTLFVSYEPALGPVDFTRIEQGGNTWVNALTGDCTTYHPYGGSRTLEKSLPHLNWVIIGAQTGPGAVKPKMSWLLVAEQAQEAGVPVFIKDNAADYYGGELLPRQFPRLEAIK